MLGWMNHKLELIAMKNINNLRQANDTTLMADNEEGLKSFLMRVREESRKAGLKLNIQKTKFTTFSPIISRQIKRGKVEEVSFYFLGLQNHYQ